MPRVVVTGIGVVSPLGRGARTTMDALLEGKRAITPLHLFELEGARTSLAAQANVVSEDAGWSRADTMAKIAAAEALAEAGLVPSATQVSLFVGGTTAGMFECETDLARLTRTPSAPFDKQVFRAQPLQAPGDRLHETLGPFASTRAICSACSGGAIALMLAASAIRNGTLERAVAGGVDSLSRLSFAGFAALGALDTSPCRPFDKGRAGLSLGEGAAFMVLESEGSARARGATILCELAGWASASEAHHITHPEPEGATAASVMAAALEKAGLDVTALDYLNAHGTGTPHNDAMETAAIATFLGDHVARVAVSSVKGAIGHALGASGAIEAAVAALAVVRGDKPPTAGLERPAPNDALRHLFAAEKGRVRAAMSNAFGFGGTDVTLLFSEKGLAPVPEARAVQVVVTGVAAIGPRRDPADYLLPGPAPRDERADFAEDGLDAMRARRLARAARLFTAAAERALAGVPERHAAAIVAGTAWGSPAATERFLVELFEKGPRFASPALFPSALPSAIASGASIYLGLHGAAFTTADLGASAESAILSGIELVERGEAAVVVCGGVEEKSEVARRVSSPTGSAIPDRGRRGEGAGAIVFENAETASGPVLAEVVFHRSWRGRRPDLPSPTATRTRVLLAREDLDVPEGWGSRLVVADAAGDHEAVGAITFAAAISALEHDDEILVLGGGPDRGYAFGLRRGKQP